MKPVLILIVLGIALFHLGLAQPIVYEKGTFGYDLTLMQAHYKPIVLKSGKSRIALLADFQGRVMTSSSAGDQGESYGWFDRSSIEKGVFAEKNNVLGGEDRLWFGPEYGEFSLFFPHGRAMTGQNLVVPPVMDTESYELVSKTENTAIFFKEAILTNYKNTSFTIAVTRKVSLLKTEEILGRLGIQQNGLSIVGFESHNTMKNTGTEDWSKDYGLVCLWSLSAFPSHEDNMVIIPVEEGHHTPVTQYWTKVGKERLRRVGNTILYKADGNHMHKIGLKAEKLCPVLASYSPSKKLLTIVRFSYSGKGDYVNSLWDKNAPPYEGDVINVFNDGPMKERGPFGPLYELETSSEAKALKVGQSIDHKHSTYHFEGTPEQLNKIAKKVLGANLEELMNTFHQ